ncbi:MAG: leucine-rich repeat domain-containing protein [Flavobacterium sp.]|nr:leucine-rich repeat domain-containing protein [Flavobacterium sp.]
MPSTVTNNGITYTLTAIGSSSFQDNSNLNVVVIPNTVTTIKSNAFTRCTSLTSVTISDSVTSIEHSAFSYSGLTSVIVPDSIISLENMFLCQTFNFSYTSQFSTIIEDYGFALYSGLYSSQFQIQLLRLVKGRFISCQNLASISFPNSLTLIGDLHFMIVKFNFYKFSQFPYFDWY